MTILKKYRKSKRTIRLILDISLDVHATLQALLEEEIRATPNPTSYVCKRHLRYMKRALKEIIGGKPIYEDNFKK